MLEEFRYEVCGLVTTKSHPLVRDSMWRFRPLRCTGGLLNGVRDQQPRGCSQLLKPMQSEELRVLAQAKCCRIRLTVYSGMISIALIDG